MRPTSLIFCVAIICISQLIAIADFRQPEPNSTDIKSTAPVAAPKILPVRPFHPRPVMLGRQTQSAPPDFTRHTDVFSKKQAFYDYLLPKIDRANLEISRERDWLLYVERKLLLGSLPSEEEELHLRAMEKRYAGTHPASLTVYARIVQLIPKVDVVPASLVLAQAAKESGWGTSRFAREGNNFFGIWCFNRGCGLTPARRDAGRTHEVAVFDTVEEGIRYYIRTINTHVAYEDLRKIRSEARRTNQPFAGEQLATGLLRYSERGLRYVNEIRSIIRVNKLAQFTREYSA